MKHICYLTASLTRKDSLIWERQGRTLATKGFEVSFIVSDEKQNEILDDVNIISTGYMPSSRMKRMLFAKKKLFNTAIDLNADIYQISEPELISLGIKLLKRNKKVIYNMREYYPSLILTKEYIPYLFRKPIAILLEKYMRMNLKKFDAIFSVSPEVVELTKIKLKCRKSYLLTNYPIVNHDFQLTFDEYLNRGNVLCYIGSIYRISRQEVFFKALERIPETKYLIAGKFEDKYQNVLESLPYWSRVEFINGFKKNDMPDILARASISNVLRDFTKTSSPNGSLGIIKIFESMEAAIPIICSDVPLYKDIINRYNCGICVDPNNSNEIENAIRYLVNNKKEAFQMGQNARRAVIEEYNWNSQSVKYLDVINDIILK